MQATIELLRVPFLDSSTKPAWTPHPDLYLAMPQSFIRQAMYRRLWISDREQLVYQGTIGV
jgi:hypothetical protein